MEAVSDIVFIGGWRQYLELDFIREMDAMKVLVLNGPNINFLGIREKGIYGQMGYEELCSMLREEAARLGMEIDIFQSNSEGGLIDRIQTAYSDGTEAIIINPGAYTHYSYALRDALASVSMPKLEVHISNVHKREEFRHTSVTAPVCDGQLVGLGVQGYVYALEAVYHMTGR